MRVETERLAAIPLFSGLPADELAAVAAMAGELDVPLGKTVCKEGDFGHTVFAVESGTAGRARRRCRDRDRRPGRRDR